MRPHPSSRRNCRHEAERQPRVKSTESRVSRASSRRSRVPTVGFTDPCSMRLMVLRPTPLLSASSPCVSPLAARSRASLRPSSPARLYPSVISCRTNPSCVLRPSLLARSSHGSYSSIPCVLRISPMFCLPGGAIRSEIHSSTHLPGISRFPRSAPPPA